MLKAPVYALNVKNKESIEMEFSLVKLLKYYNNGLKLLQIRIFRVIMKKIKTQNLLYIMEIVIIDNGKYLYILIVSNRVLYKQKRFTKDI